MAATIPQLEIDARDLHTARRKLQAKAATGKVALSRQEREALLSLIQRGRRHIYPSQTQIEQYQHAIDQLGSINRANNPAQFDHFAGRIEKFEHKFCS